MLKDRFKRPLKNWIMCALWTTIYILFIIWLGNYWWLFLLPLIFDLYITKFIPWSFWKKTKNKALYTICSWLDAIIFALVAVYFINLYLFQNYQIPSSSLEKTLLVGDFLFVSKASYGPRTAMTPLSFPLVQNTFPILNCNSYFVKPQWPYHRLKGWAEIETGNIVVFNFPEGDTVTARVSNPDYYTLCYIEASRTAQFNQFPDDSIMSYQYINERHAAGKKVIEANKGSYGNIIWRPVDRRENYVKRCVALPGEVFEMRESQVYINGEAQVNPPLLEHNYYVLTDGSRFSEESLVKMDITLNEVSVMNSANGPVYRMSLTNAALDKIKQLPFVKAVKMEESEPNKQMPLYPLAYSGVWSRDNYGPLWIPKKGESIELTEDNLIRYSHCIVNYEGNTLEYKNNIAYLNGEPATKYTFKMDYYYMLGDNRHNSADSRAWGFVPEDHVVGRPIFVWLSLNPDKKWFHGKIRWNRFGKEAWH